MSAIACCSLNAHGQVLPAWAAGEEPGWKVRLLNGRQSLL